MPLLDLEYWKIHSFSQFSFTCIDISGWNFTYDFVLLYYRSSSSVVNFRHFLMELYPFRNVEDWKFSFPHFSLTLFDILSWNFAYDFVLLYYRLSLSFLNLRWFWLELCPFWKSEYWKYTVFCTFLLRALTYWAETLHMTLFNVQKIKFECHNSVSVWLSVRPSIFCTFLLHTSTYLAEN